MNRKLEFDQLKMTEFVSKKKYQTKNNAKVTFYTKKKQPIWLARGFLLSCYCNSLTLQSSAVVLGVLPSARQSLDVPDASVALYLLQSPDSQSIEPSLQNPKPNSSEPSGETATI